MSASQMLVAPTYYTSSKWRFTRP